MSKFNELLSFTSSCGRKFELLEGEKLAIDGVDFTSTWGSRASYVMFVTNKRIIIKQGNISWTGRGAESAFLSSVRFLMLEDVKTIKFTSRPGYGLDGIVIDGLFRDFSVKEKTGSSDCEAGTLASGFGGLEYSNKEDFYHGITRTFSALAKEHNFGFYCNGANKHLSTISKQEAHVKQREIQMGQFGAIVFAALFFVGVAIYGANRRDNKPEIPQFDQSTIVRPQRDATGQYDYVLPNTKSYQHTCYTTAYPGSDTVTSKAFGCNIIDDSRASVAIKNVEWSDGIQTRFTIVGSRASIATNGNFSSADWSIVTHEGVRYYLFEADEGASTWIPYNIH